MTVITLIGYRASGKSAVAPVLASRLGWGWIDADTELQSRFGMSIAEMFEQQGEAWFRDQEQRLMLELLRRDSIVIAAGGGAVLNEQTRAAAREVGPVVWLQASPETIISRIAADAKTDAQRPPLTDLSLEDEIRSVLAERAPVYNESAGVIVSVDDTAPEEITNQIWQALPMSLQNVPRDQKDIP